MKILVVGNGLAGTLGAKTLRELDSEVEIEILAEESYAYYPRPNLIEYIAGALPYERLFAFPSDWTDRQRVGHRLETPVGRIHPSAQEVEIGGGKREKYDRLLLAHGSSSFVPPIKGSEKMGVFSLKTLDDAQRIIEYLKTHDQAVIVGGGLLGLEIARAFRTRGAEVELVEFFDRLLPRQLDSEGAALLRSQVEKLGIRVRLGLATEEILGENEVVGLRFKSGDEIAADTVVMAAGVRPNLAVAKEAGIQTDRGIVVDDRMQTSVPGIFAAGDCTQHNGRVYGIIPAAFDQCRVAASNILGEEKKYVGTVPSNTLKVVGLYVTSIGLVNPEGPEFEELRRENLEAGVYKKIVLQDGHLVGAIWMGTKKGAAEIGGAVSRKTNIEKWKHALLEENFDFTVL